MAATSATVIPTDLIVRGSISASGGVSLAANQVGNSEIDSSDPIQASKLYHRHSKVYAQPNTTAAAETKVVHVAEAAGVVQSIKAGVLVAGSGGGMSVTVDLKKNGTTILTAVITLNASTVAFVLANGTLGAGATYALGDVFTIVIAATAGGGTLPTGVFANVVFDEQPA